MSLFESEKRFLLYDRLSKSINQNSYGSVKEVLLEKKELLYAAKLHQHQIDELLHDKQTLVDELKLIKRISEDRNINHEKNQNQIVSRYESEFEKLKEDNENKADIIQGLSDQIIKLQLHEVELSKRVNNNVLLSKLKVAENRNKVCVKQVKANQETADKQIQSLKLEKEVLVTSFAKKELANEKVIAKCKQQESKHKELLQSKYKLESTINEKEADLSKQKLYNNNLNDHIIELKFKLEDKSKMVKFLFEKCKQIDHIATDVKGWKVKCHKLQKNNKLVNEKCKKLKKDKRSLESKLKEVKSKDISPDSKKLKEKFEKLKGKNEKYADKVKTLKEKLDGEKDMLRSSKNEKNCLEKLLAKKTKDFNAMAEEVACLKSKTESKHVIVNQKDGPSDPIVDDYENDDFEESSERRNDSNGSDYSNESFEEVISEKSKTSEHQLDESIHDVVGIPVDEEVASDDTQSDIAESVNEVDELSVIAGNDLEESVAEASEKSISNGDMMEESVNEVANNSVSEGNDLEESVAEVDEISVQYGDELEESVHEVINSEEKDKIDTIDAYDNKSFIRDGQDIDSFKELDDLQSSSEGLNLNLAEDLSDTNGESKNFSSKSREFTTVERDNESLGEAYEESIADISEKSNDLHFGDNINLSLPYLNEEQNSVENIRTDQNIMTQDKNQGFIKEKNERAVNQNIGKLDDLFNNTPVQTSPPSFKPLKRNGTKLNDNLTKRNDNLTKRNDNMFSTGYENNNGDKTSQLHLSSPVIDRPSLVTPAKSKQEKTKQKSKKVNQRPRSSEQLSAEDIFGASSKISSLAPITSDRLSLSRAPGLSNQVSSLSGAPALSSLNGSPSLSSQGGKPKMSFFSEAPSLTPVAKSSRKAKKSKSSKKKGGPSAVDPFGVTSRPSPSKRVKDDINSVLDALF